MGFLDSLKNFGKKAATVIGKVGQKAGAVVSKIGERLPGIIQTGQKAIAIGRELLPTIGGLIGLSDEQQKKASGYLDIANAGLQKADETGKFINTLQPTIERGTSIANKFAETGEYSKDDLSKLLDGGKADVLRGKQLLNFSPAVISESFVNQRDE